MKKLFKKTKKGFTLVELLVVIAILAVLASVSVIGYLGFVEKARNSDAVTELAQVRELLRAELIDGEEHTFKFKAESTGTSYDKSYTMKYVDGDYYLLDLKSDTSIVPSTTDFVDVTSAFTLSETLSDLNGLNTTIKVKLSKAASKGVGGTEDSDNGVTDYKIDIMTYARTAGGSAYWTVSGDKITAGAYSAS